MTTTKEDELSVCPVCRGEGGFFDDGMYNPDIRKMEGSGMRACRHCGGSGIDPDYEEVE